MKWAVLATFLIATVGVGAGYELFELNDDEFTAVGGSTEVRDVPITSPQLIGLQAEKRNGILCSHMTFKSGNTWTPNGRITEPYQYRFKIPVVESTMNISCTYTLSYPESEPQNATVTVTIKKNPWAEELSMLQEPLFGTVCTDTQRFTEGGDCTEFSDTGIVKVWHGIVAFLLLFVGLYRITR